MNEATDLAGVDVVILAGGLGTRLRPVLADRPKLLAPVGERAYLDVLLDWLIGFNATRVILSLGHMADKVIDYLDRRPVARPLIETVIEDQPKGTAGALELVRPRVRSATALVMNGDSWVDADLGDFRAFHERQGAVITLLAVHVDDAGRYGQLDIDAGNRVRAFREKRPDTGPGPVNAGIYAFSAAAWELIRAAPGPSLEHDVFERQPPGTLAAFDAGSLPFIDIGTPESLQRAARVIGRCSDDGGNR